MKTFFSLWNCQSVIHFGFRYTICMGLKNSLDSSRMRMRRCSVRLLGPCVMSSTRTMKIRWRWRTTAVWLSFWVHWQTVAIRRRDASLQVCCLLRCFKSHVILALLVLCCCVLVLKDICEFIWGMHFSPAYLWVFFKSTRLLHQLCTFLEEG